MTERKQWKNLSLPQKIGAVLAVFVQVSLLVAALVDIRRRPAEQVRGPKWAWAMAAFINYFGPLSYFLFGRRAAPQQQPPG
jgi:uncharacterized membrane protein